MKSKISIPHVVLTVFCFAGLHFFLYITLSIFAFYFQTYWVMPMSYSLFAAIGFVSALLSTTFSRGSKIADISIAAIGIALLQTGISLGAYQIQNLDSSLQPISTSVSLSAICIAGAVLGARTGNRWHTLVAPSNLFVNISVAILTIFGSMYLVYFSCYTVVLLSESFLPLAILATLIFCPMIAGYVVQSCSDERVETHFFIALILLYCIVCTWMMSEHDFLFAIIAAIISLVLAFLYNILANVGIGRARKRKDAQSNTPDIPNATALHS